MPWSQPTGRRDDATDRTTLKLGVDRHRLDEANQPIGSSQGDVDRPGLMIEYGGMALLSGRVLTRDDDRVHDTT